MNDQNAFRVIIIRTSSIGDVILATSLLNFLEQLDMPIETIWFGSKPSLDLIEKAYPRVQCVAAKEFEPAQLELFLKNLGPIDAVIDLQRTLRSRMMVRKLRKFCGAAAYEVNKERMSRIQFILEARLRGRRMAAPERIQKAAFRQYELMIEPLREAIKDRWTKMRGQAAAHDAMKALRNGHPNLKRLLDEELPPHLRELTFGRWIAIAPGAAHPTKRAPSNLFVRVIQMLHKRLSFEEAQQPVGFVFVGDDQDRKIAIEVLEQTVGTERVLNYAGRLSLQESAQVLGQCQALFSNDSSLAHLAESVGTPAAIIFGPTVEAFGFAPWRQESQSFSSLLGCRPCSKHGKVPCRYGDKRCFSDILLQPITYFLMRCLADKEATPQDGPVNALRHRAPLLRASLQEPLR